MQHKTDVLLVDAHAEGVGREHDVALRTHEAFLHRAALLRRELAVVDERVDPGTLELRVQRLEVADQRRIDDARAVDRAHALGEQRHLLLGEVDACGGEEQLRPFDARAHDQRIAQREARDDVGGDLRRRGRGERDRRRRADARAVFTEPRVVGPEVVPPLAHAVRLVDRHARNAQFRREFDEIRGSEALRRHVQELELAPRRRL